MKSAVETLSPTRAKITVEVPFEELKPSLDAAYQSIAKQINIPGFRKGKVPPPVIDRQVGRGAVLDEAINDALPKLYVQALQDNDLQPLAQPEIDVTKLEDNTLFEFTAEVDVRPSIEVPSYDGLSVQVDDVTVSDDDVDEQVEAPAGALRHPQGRRAPAAGRRRRHHRPQGHPRRRGRRGRRGQRLLLQGRLRRHARGHRRGAARPERRRGDDLHLAACSAATSSGQDVEVTVKLSAVKEQELPELDDEFAQTASEFDTIEELREDVATRLERGKRLEQAAAARDAVLEQLLDSRRDPAARDRGRPRSSPGRRQEIEQQLVYAGMSMEPTSTTRSRPSTSSRPSSRSGSATRWPRSSCSTRSPRAEEIGVEQDELHAAPDAPGPAVGPEPRRVHQAHGRAQPHPRDGLRGRARQGAGAHRRGRHRHRRSPATPST